MSKGFNALNDLRKDSINHLDVHVKWLNEKLDIIENALKALKIIKEKGNFISLEYDKYDDKYYIYDNELYMHNEITKEEYDLLKEVLL